MPVLSDGGAMGAPCQDWPLNEACSRGIPADPGSRSAVQAYAVSVATELLWRATASVYGVCELTVRPCGRSCSQAAFSYWPVQTSSGEWINVTCGCLDNVCGCCNVSEIRLDGPVAEITQILIDGQVVDPSTYRVDNSYLLTRVSPADPWPKCQDLSLPSTEPNTFEVIYQRGIPVPVGGQYALAALAAEVVDSCNGSDCRLPARVQEITRQGMTMSVINDLDFLRSALTGIPEVDAWISAVNPFGHHSQPTVYSPDLQPTLRYMA